MGRATFLMGLTALALTAGRVPAADKDDSRGGAADLVGAYSIVSGEREGAPEPADRVKGTMVRFSQDRVVVVDKESKEIYGAEYKLDTGKTPWKITMKSKLAPADNQIARGLIEKDGDTVRLVYALPGGDEPTGFKTKSKQLMFVMKSMKKNPAP